MCTLITCLLGSIQDNIVFGEEYNGERYQAAVAACALEEDIASLPAGSATELGERGINLSGGSTFFACDHTQLPQRLLI